MLYFYSFLNGKSGLFAMGEAKSVSLRQNSKILSLVAKNIQVNLIFLIRLFVSLCFNRKSIHDENNEIWRNVGRFRR